jgi:pimeloyl-ACP methyl ester carboxylesterase
MTSTSCKLLTSSDGMPIFADASGDPSNPHVVLIHGLSLSAAVFDDFCRREDLLQELYIVHAIFRFILLLLNQNRAGSL